MKYLLPLILIAGIIIYPQLVIASWAEISGPMISTGNETAQTSTVWSVFQTTTAGNVAVLHMAMDNRGTSDGNSSQLTSVVDSQGNTWNKVGEFTNTVGGAAADGTTVAVWYSVLNTTLTGGVDTITTTYSGSLTAKAIVVKTFSIGAGNTVQVIGTVQTLNNDNSDAGSMTVSGLTSGEYLFFRATAQETNNLVATTPTTGYTDIVGFNSGSAGNEKNHQAVSAEFRILTATNSTSDPTMSDTTADRASLFFALQEVASGPVVDRTNQYTVRDSNVTIIDSNVTIRN